MVLDLDLLSAKFGLRAYVALVENYEWSLIKLNVENVSRIAQISCNLKKVLIEGSHTNKDLIGQWAVGVANQKC